MIVKEFSVKNFRNIKSAEFVFSEKTNIIGGSNAQGKTNLMEALTCAVERSFRTNKAAELVPDFGGECSISLKFVVDAHPNKINRLDCNINENGIERKINGISYKDGIKLYPQLKTIIFIPEDLYLVKGSPDARRDLADDTADMMNKVHRNIVGNYFRAMKQKNAYLASLHEAGRTRSDYVQMDVWNEEVAKAGVNVMVGRIKYFGLLSRYTEEFYSKLNNRGETLRMEYQSSVMEDTPFTIADVDLMLDTYLRKQDRNLSRELTAGHTLVGVHRDDIAFYIDGRPARDYASQGQIRSIAIALRLAQAKMFAEKWGEAPVIILDDVLSELDEERRGFILSHIVESQVFITGCNKNDFEQLGAGKYWEVEKGNFKEQ
ncbi:MAG: DNA replication and repair protein RecF [Oscillospiraceae bacterium]|nr:DNA replication and repair protein RecF [Oscillospiraceae bacterium]